MNDDPVISCSDIIEYTDIGGERGNHGRHCMHCGDDDDDCLDYTAPRNKHGVRLLLCCPFYEFEDDITPEIAEEIVRQRGHR